MTSILNTHCLLRLRLYLCFLFCLIALAQPVKAQDFTNSGTEFWLAFPEFYDLTNAEYIIYISSNTATTGTVSIPGTGFSKNFSTVIGQVTKISLPSVDATITQQEQVLARGIHVTSINPISVYAGTIHSARSEASLVLPIPSLGTNYRVMSYPTQTKSGKLWKSEFIVVATANNTTIRITPTSNTSTGKTAGTAFSISLNQGDVYMVQANALNDDLTGTSVVSIGAGHPIAVFGGHVWARILCGSNSDPLYEQMFPVPTWGKSYILLPTPTSGKDVSRVMAANDNTTVTFNGLNQQTLNAGQVYEFVYTQSTLVEGSAAISVGIFTITAAGCGNSPNGDPSVIMVNPNEQMLLDSITFFTVDDYAIAESFIHVITRTADTGTLKLNGSILFGFTVLPMDSTYSSSSFKVPANSYQLTTTGCGFLAYAIGLGSAESYAYAAGVSLVDLSCDMSFESVNELCKEFLAGAPIRFNACHDRSNFSYSWRFSDSTLGVGSEYHKTFDKPGVYIVQLITYSSCDSDTTEKRIVIKENNLSLDLYPDTVICNNPKGVLLNTYRPQFESYLWNDLTTDSVNHIYSSGLYIVHILDSSGCRFTDSILVTNAPLPPLDLESNYTLCASDSLFLEVDEGYYYQWSTSTSDTLNRLYVDNIGQYKVKIYDDKGCFREDSADVTIPKALSEIFIPNVFTPNSDQYNDSYLISLDDYVVDYFRIFNRWGELLYKIEEGSVRWDGTYKSRKLPSGTYFWVGLVGTDCGDISKASGTITLIR